MQGKEPIQRGENSQQEENQISTNREIKALRAELENVKMKMMELHNDYSELQKEYGKISNKKKITSGWNLGWRKIKHSFHTKWEGDGDDDAVDAERQRPNVVGRRLSS